MRARLAAFLAALCWTSAAQTAPTADLLSAKLAVDRQIDPKTDPAWTRREVGKLVNAATVLAGPHPTAAMKITALRTLLYKAGPWNENRPFDYDHDEAHFKGIPVTLLDRYLRTRLGNCISMPILFLILADRLGLSVELSRAPHHLYVRYTDPQGRTFNIEPTSGANAQKTAWIRFINPMTDDAILNGVYLSDLTREQTLAELQGTLVGSRLEEGRYDEAISISSQMIDADPRNATAYMWRGVAYFHLISAEFPTRPKVFSPRFEFLLAHNVADMTMARRLGWRDDLSPKEGVGELTADEVRRDCPKCVTEPFDAVPASTILRPTPAITLQQ